MPSQADKSFPWYTATGSPLSVSCWHGWRIRGGAKESRWRKEIDAPRRTDWTLRNNPYEVQKAGQRTP
jgi:hypothetical protein